MNGFLHIVVSCHGFTANDVGPIAIESDDIDEYVDSIIGAMEGIDFSGLTHISVSGADDGAVFVGDDGRPLRPVMWATDEESSADAGWCLKKHDASWWMDEVGLVPTHRNLVTKLSLLHRSEPDTWARMRRVCSPAQYVRWRVGRDTGGAIVASSSELALTGLWNASTGRFSENVLRLIDSEREWRSVLPELRPDESSVGSLYGVLLQL